LLCVADVHRLQRGDAFDMRLVKLHRHAKGDCRHDGGLVCGVDAFDVKGGVAFGIAERLGLLQRDSKVQALAAHFADDEIGSAVDDAGDPFDAVGGQALAQRLDDGNAAGHRGFKSHHHAALAGCGKDFRAVHGQQRLVGGDHVLAGSNGLQHQAARNAGAANQLDDDVDGRVADDLARIGHHGSGIAHHFARSGHVAPRHGLDDDFTPGAALDLGLVALQDVEHAAADNTKAHQAHLNRFHAL